MQANQNKVEMIDFEDIMICFNPNYHFKKDQIAYMKLENYFEKCFIDLCSRMKEESSDSTKINKTVLASYLNLPSLVSNRIFNIFDIKYQNLINKDQFVLGMNYLYFGNLKELIELTFNMFDFNNSGKICMEEVLLLFNYLKLNEIALDIEDLVKDYFKKDDQIDLQTFEIKIKFQNSDLFILILYLLNYRQPFTEEGLKFFMTNFELNKTEEKNTNKSIYIMNSNTNSFYNIISEENFMFPPSKNLSNAIPNLIIKLKEEYNINKQIENLNLDLEEEKISQLKLIQTKISIRSETISSSNDMTSSISLESDKSEILKFSNIEINNKMRSSSLKNIEHKEINNFETIIYKLSNSNRLIKYKLVVIENNLFSFRFSKSKNNFILEDVYPLNGYFVTQCDETKLGDHIYHPLALVIQFGNSLVNLSNILFFKDKKEMCFFYSKMKILMNLKEVKDFYDFLHDIGNGQYGKVKLAVDKKTHHKVAIKTMKKKQMNNKEIELVRTEIDVMKFLINNKNRNVIKVYEILEDKDMIYIVMEYVASGTLQNYLTKFPEGLEEKEIKNLAKQIANGLKFLDKFGIIHRDMKPDNILVCSKSSQPILKIADFGLSKVLGISQKTNEGYGTLVYTAPEILLKKMYTRKVDVWSFGILVYYMYTGHLPFDGKDLNMQEVAKLICFEPLQTDKISHISAQGKQFLIKCLEKKSKDRLSIDAVSNDDWFIN